MSKCSGNCGSCGDKIDKIGTNEGPERKYFGQKDRSDEFFDIVNPPKDKKMPKFNLEDVCPHYEFGTMKRSACEICISAWALTHTIEEAEDKIEELRSSGKSVAARRVQLAFKERLHKGKIK